MSYPCSTQQCRQRKEKKGEKNRQGKRKENWKDDKGIRTVGMCFKIKLMTYPAVHINIYTANWGSKKWGSEKNHKMGRKRGRNVRKKRGKTT